MANLVAKAQTKTSSTERRKTAWREVMRRGFTLLELIVVISILAVVSSVVIPRLRGLSKGKADVAVQAGCDGAGGGAGAVQISGKLPVAAQTKPIQRATQRRKIKPGTFGPEP